MHMLRNARSIVGSYQEAAEIMEPLAKLRIIAQANRPGEDISEDFDQLVKGLEIKGVTQHPEQFKDYMNGIAKGLNTFGDTLKPYQYYEMFIYGRQATSGFLRSSSSALPQRLLRNLAAPATARSFWFQRRNRRQRDETLGSKGYGEPWPYQPRRS
jgi:hypothetical protein